MHPAYEITQDGKGAYTGSSQNFQPTVPKCAPPPGDLYDEITEFA